MHHVFDDLTVGRFAIAKVPEQRDEAPRVLVAAGEHLAVGDHVPVSEVGIGLAL
ncbi:hypothetical protein D3C83_294220 [compost metagenome]